MMKNNFFLEASNNWDLKKLYIDINFIKEKKLGQKKLTYLEKIILRGLLCGYNPSEIASKLPEESKGLIINLSWKLDRCLKSLVVKELSYIHTECELFGCLEALGYKINLLSQQVVKKEKVKTENNIPLLETTVETNALSRENSQLPIDQELNFNVTDQQPSTTLLLAPIKETKQELEQKTFLLNQITKVAPTNYLPTVAENDFLPPISRWTTLGGLFLVSTIVITIATAAMTPYNVSVKADAKVRPAGELRIVQAQTEGKIVKIAVSENQSVKRGDTIALIDNSRFQTTKTQLENKIQQARLQIQQINAQIQAQQRQILAENDRVKNTIAAETAALSRSYREYQDKKLTSLAQVQEAEANLRASEEELQKQQAQLKSAQATQKSAEATLNAAKSKLNRYQTIAASGALSQDLLEEAQLTVEQQQQAVAAQIATVEEQQQAIKQQQQVIEATQARLDNAQAALNPSDADIAIANKTIAKEQAIGQANLASLNGEKEALIQQRLEIEKQLKEDKSELEQIKLEIDKTIIKAPTEGIVFQLNLRNSDQTVTTGEKIAQIVPSQTSLAIETLVATEDISKVKIGQPAQIKISACPYPDYGTLKGKVSNISPDIIAPENNLSQSPIVSNLSSQNINNSFYVVTVYPDSLLLNNNNQKCFIQLGMEGKADLISEKETVLKFVLRKIALLN